MGRRQKPLIGPTLSLLLLLASGLMGCDHSTANQPVRKAATVSTPAPVKNNGVPAPVLPSAAAESDHFPDERSQQFERTEAADAPSIEITAADPEPVVQEKIFPRTKPAKPNRFDNEQLFREGIRTFESKRLTLVTDINALIANSLPPLVDHAYDALGKYFGPFSSNRDHDDFHMTGYIMSRQQPFRRLELLPSNLRRFDHGRHREDEFWMNDQTYDYYRRHLMIHEATHCYMLTLRKIQAPVWYLEGMAELFATHAFDADGKIHFSVMPARKEDFVGLGRIQIIEKEVQAGRVMSINDIRQFVANEFLDTKFYAWSWALCKFLDTHPAFQTRFRKLRVPQTSRQFRRAFDAEFRKDRDILSTEWLLFAANLEHGYDIPSAAIDFQPGRRRGNHNQPSRINIETNRGWQSSRLLVEAGREYLITATGQFTLAQQPKPWLSEPQGISFLYSRGFPLGMLQATIHSPKTTAKTGHETMLDVIPIGAKKHFTAPVSGTLYLRVNDFPHDRANNQGTVNVQIQPLR